MSITRIKSIKDHGVFRGFQWSPNLIELKKFNLIYGWNGTGKSTLARILQCLEKREAPSEGKVILEISGQCVDGTEFPSRNDHIRVFNKEFIEDNVFRSDDRVSPIFVIGKENIEKQKRLDELRKDLAKQTKARDLLRQKLKSASQAFEAHCTSAGKLVKESIGGHGNRFANYNRKRYQVIAEKLRQEVSYSPKSQIQREELLVRCRASNKGEVSGISFEAPDFEQLLAKATELCRRELVDSVIENLATDSLLADWVGKGMGLHEGATPVCKFCEQPIPQQRMQKLRQHFSDEFTVLQSQISSLGDEIDQIKSRLDEIVLPKKVEFFEDISKNYDHLKLLCQAEIDGWQDCLSEIRRTILQKKATPFEAVSTDHLIVPKSAGAIRELETLIEAHNRECRDFQNRVERSLDAMEREFAIDEQKVYRELLESQSNSQVKYDSAQARLEGIESTIASLEVDIVSHREPAENLNASLQSYLGHGDLRLEVSELGYTITRSGKVAKLLSEGERTAIALLYFLERLNDRSFDKSKGIVVFDDPVSSLDGNALFNAFAYVKDKTAGVSQILLLTHNYAFFRAIRQWFRNLRGADKREARILMTKAGIDEGGRASEITEIDPLLNNFESEYHYLFSKIMEICDAPMETNLEQYLIAPTIARRVLESFLAFRVPGPDNLHTKLHSLSCDDTLRSRVYRFVNTFSHSDAIADGGEDLSILSETRSVLSDLLTLMRSEDATHVSRMEACVRTSKDSS